MRCVLREVRDEDLAVLFEQWADPVAARMAAFTAPDHMDRDAFERRWSRIRADETVIARAIVVDGEVAGTIGSWGNPDEREVTYWIGRSYARRCSDRRTGVTARLLPKVTRKVDPATSTWTPDSAWLSGRGGKRTRTRDLRRDRPVLAFAG